MNHITVKHEPPRRHPLLRPWPGLVILALALHSGLMIAAAVLAAADGPPAVEPRFYEKAVAWDEVAAQREANRRLGWHAAWDAATGPAGARVRLTDGQGAPINNATCSVEYFHRAHSGTRRSAGLTFVGDGVYLLPDPLRVPGDHEFRLTARTDEGLFTDKATATVRLPAEAHAP